MAKYHTFKELTIIKSKKTNIQSKLERRKIILEKIIGLVEQGVFDKQPKMISGRMLRINGNKRKSLKALVEDLIGEEWS